MKFHSHILGSLCAILACSCAMDPATRAERQRQKEMAAKAEGWSLAHQQFRTDPSWKTATYRNEELLSQLSPENSSIRVGLKEQRALLLLDGEQVAMDFKVSSGKRGFSTPKGDFKVLQKNKDHRSSKYGSYVDGTSGETVASDVDSTRDAKPEGASYVGASMPYFCRITPDGVGFHIGYVPNYPASHGCIRVPRAVMPTVWDKVKLGTPVTVADYTIAPAATPETETQAPAKPQPEAQASNTPAAQPGS